jgi:scyllo-inositol 2-dehydrogenase (NADP+)
MALRVALLGYGPAGSALHAPLVDAVDGLELAAVVTRDEERRAQARARHPTAELLDGSEDLWERAAALDLVVVATPNRTHVPLARAALEAGLPVVVDKPLAATAAEARELAALAAERGLLLTVFQNRRWDGDFLTLSRLAGEGRLGRVLRFESRYERWRPDLQRRWRESGAPEDAGGVLYDLGSHLIDQALQLLGPARCIHAELDRRREGAQVDDDTFVALEHDGGARSHLWMSLVAAQLGPRFRVLGDRGAYVKHGLDVQEEALRTGRLRPGAPEWGREPESAWGLLGVDGGATRVPTKAGAYQRFYEGVVRALTEGAPPPVDPADAVAALDLIEAAREIAANSDGATGSDDGVHRG